MVTVAGGRALHHQVASSRHSRLFISAFIGELEPPPFDVPLLALGGLHGRRLAP